MIKKRTWLMIALLPLLLAAQHVAIAHQVSHLLDPLSMQGSQQDDAKKTAHSGLCDYHVAFAELLGSIGPSALQLALAATAVEAGAATTFAAPTRTRVAYASRGPPVLR